MKEKERKKVAKPKFSLVNRNYGLLSRSKHPDQQQQQQNN